MQQNLNFSFHCRSCFPVWHLMKRFWFHYLLVSQIEIFCRFIKSTDHYTLFFQIYSKFNHWTTNIIIVWLTDVWLEVSSKICTIYLELFVSNSILLLLNKIINISKYINLLLLLRVYNHEPAFYSQFNQAAFFFLISIMRIVWKFN